MKSLQGADVREIGMLSLEVPSSPLYPFSPAPFSDGLSWSKLITTRRQVSFLSYPGDL